MSEETSTEMSFLDHVEELRWRIIRSLVALFAATVLCLAFYRRILDLLILPVNRLSNPMHLQVLKVQGMFVVTLEVAFFGGLILSLPYILYQFWKFIAPGLLESERRYFPKLIGSSTLLFLMGVLFAYLLVLPFALNFFIGLAPPEIAANIAIDFYIGFTIRLLVIFGLIFEMPVITYFLSRLGLLTPERMRHYRRHAVVAIFIVAAILTPPDVITQVMLAIPLILLYELSILVSAVVEKQARKHIAHQAGVETPTE